MQNGLQLNPDKSEALIIGTAHQLRAATLTVSSVTVVDVNLPLANEMKVLGVTLDRHLTFEKHVSAIARSCNCHNQAIRHIRHLLATQLAQTLACSLICQGSTTATLCSMVFHPATSRSYSVFRTSEQCSTDRSPGAKAISRQATTTPAALAAGSTPNHVQVGGTDVQGPDHIDAGVPESSHQAIRDSVRILRSTMSTRLSEPFASTAFAKRAFCCSAPATWNSRQRTVTDNDSLGTFKSRLKTFLFSLAFN